MAVAGRPPSDEQVALDHGDIIEAPTWFGPADRPLFGWFVYPRSLRVRGAVVLCQPVAEESNMAYRTFRTLSQQLAREGFLALRFDYDGTGDSAGDFSDPNRTTAWSDSIVHAVAESRRWGTDCVSVVGMRLGATLAYLAAASGTLDLDDLILWDPCVSARSFLRELQLLQSAWMESAVPADVGWVETPHYRFTAEFAAAAPQAAIDGRVRAAALARRTTVLFRQDRTPSPKLLAALPREHTEWKGVRGQAQLVGVEAIFSTVPHESVAEVTAQLLRAASEAHVVIRVRLKPTARWRHGGQELDETACFFPAESALFGIRTSGSSADPSRPQLLFLNIASKRHLGEGRIWVQLARESAANGFVSIRLDQSGVGDSATRPAHPDDTVYDEGWIDDVPYVAHAVSADSLPNVIGIGLCSSGFSALQAATLGSFREVIVINVPFDPDMNARRRRWTVFGRKPTWLTRLPRMHRRVAGLAGLIWSVSSIVDPRRDVLWTSRSIVARGIEVTVMSGPEDLNRIHQNPLWRWIWGRPLTTSGRFRLQALPNADHSLSASSGRDEVVQAVLDRLRTYVSTANDGASPNALGMTRAQADVEPGSGARSGA